MVEKMELKKSRQKSDYIKKMETLFGIEKGEYRREDARLKKILDTMIRWYYSLPQYTLRFQYPAVPIEREYLKKIKKFCAIFQIQDLDPNEVLFGEIPAIAGEGREYLYCLERMKEWKAFLEDYEELAKEAAANRMKEVFGYEESEITEQISKIFQDTAAADWTDESLDLPAETLGTVKREVEGCEKEDNQTI